MTFAVLASSEKSEFKMSLLKIFVQCAFIVLLHFFTNFDVIPSEPVAFFGFNDLIILFISVELPFGKSNDFIGL